MIIICAWLRYHSIFSLLGLPTNPEIRLFDLAPVPQLTQNGQTLLRTSRLILYMSFGDQCTCSRAKCTQLCELGISRDAECPAWTCHSCSECRIPNTEVTSLVAEGPFWWFAERFSLAIYYDNSWQTYSTYNESLRVAMWSLTISLLSCSQPSCRVAIESRKQAARRPSPPLPKAGSASSLNKSCKTLQAVQLHVHELMPLTFSQLIAWTSPRASFPSPQRLPAHVAKQMDNNNHEQWEMCFNAVGQYRTVMDYLATKCSVLELLFQVQVRNGILHVATNQVLCWQVVAPSTCGLLKQWCCFGVIVIPCHMISFMINPVWSCIDFESLFTSCSR